MNYEPFDKPMAPGKTGEVLILNFNHHRKPRLRAGLGHLELILAVFTFTLSYLPTFSFTSFADTPPPTPSATPAHKSPYRVTVIPNPASGTKLAFRIMAPGPCKVRIRVTNRFFDVVAKLDKEGSNLFDILWSLKDVSEGIYYYQAQIMDKATGQVTQSPLQKFVVLKSPG